MDAEESKQAQKNSEYEVRRVRKAALIQRRENKPGQLLPLGANTFVSKDQTSGVNHVSLGVNTFVTEKQSADEGKSDCKVPGVAKLKVELPEKEKKAFHTLIHMVKHILHDGSRRLS